MNNLLVEEKELEKAVLTLEKVIVCVLPIVIHACMHASSTLRLIHVCMMYASTGTRPVP